MTATSSTSVAPPRRAVRSGLRAAALAVVLATLGFWAAKGAHTGWSMHQVPTKQTDEITGLEFVTYEKRYVPGVDFLGIAAGVAAGLFAVSFFVQRKNIKSKP